MERLSQSSFERNLACVVTLLIEKLRKVNSKPLMHYLTTILLLQRSEIWNLWEPLSWLFHVCKERALQGWMHSRTRFAFSCYKRKVSVRNRSTTWKWISFVDRRWGSIRHDACDCLAVVKAVSLLPPYFEGCTLAVCTDYDVLKWTLHFTNSTSKLTRCWVRLSELGFDVTRSVDIIIKQPMLFRQCILLEPIKRLSWTK